MKKLNLDEWYLVIRFWFDERVFRCENLEDAICSMIWLEKIDTTIYRNKKLQKRLKRMWVDNIEFSLKYWLKTATFYLNKKVKKWLK